MTNRNKFLKATPADDLELYELLVAAYPEKFDENSEEDIWDKVMEFAEEIGDIDALCELLGRLVYLSMPMQSAISGEARQSLGTVEIKNGKAYMTAAISRTVKITPKDN